MAAQAGRNQVQTCDTPGSCLLGLAQHIGRVMSIEHAHGRLLALRGGHVLIQPPCHCHWICPATGIRLMVVCDSPCLGPPSAAWLPFSFCAFTILSAQRTSTTSCVQLHEFSNITPCRGPQQHEPPLVFHQSSDAQLIEPALNPGPQSSDDRNGPGVLHARIFIQHVPIQPATS